MTPYYYVREIEKILIALMDVFNNIRVNKYKDLRRKDYDRTIAVPIVTHSNANFANYVSSTLTTQDPMPVPIIGFRFTSNSHDDANMVQPCYAREILSPSLQKFIRDIQPTPFVFNFEMTVLSNNWSDYVQMKEQIEPYFNTYRAFTRNRCYDTYRTCREAQRDVVLECDNLTELNARRRQYFKHSDNRAFADSCDFGGDFKFFESLFELGCSIVCLVIDNPVFLVFKFFEEAVSRNFIRTFSHAA